MHKIKITNKFDIKLTNKFDTVFGKLKEDETLNMVLSEKEFEGLMLFMGAYSEAREDLALLDFIFSTVITPYHRRLIQKNMKILNQIKIEIIW